MNWWNYPPRGGLGINPFLSGLWERGLNEGIPVCRVADRRAGKPEVVANLRNYVTEILGGKAVQIELAHGCCEDDECYCDEAMGDSWAWENGYVSVIKEEDDDDGDTVYVQGYFLNRKEGEAFYRLYCELTRKIERGTRSNVLALLSNKHRGLYVDRIGTLECPIDRLNYSAPVMEAFDRVVAELPRRDCRGKVVILDGPAGTGKTWWIKGLMTAMNDHRFLLVPPAMIAKFGSPEMLPVLVDQKDGDNPLICILEDADEVLTAEGRKNIESLSSVLNLGDGILGSTLNIRLILTTNTPIEKIDAALLRPGRLLERVQIGKLPINETREWLKAKGRADMISDTRSMTLAELYARVGGEK